MNTGNNKLILKYQSIWCTLEKIKVLNIMTGKDLKKCLRANNLRQKFIYDFDSIYISQYKFDKDSLIDLCAKDIFNQIKYELKEVLGNIYNTFDMEKYIVTNFRFCPECIKTGYHSIFHQLNLFDKCIFHDIYLENKCPSCHKINPYYLNYDDTTYGFSCDCGYNYLKFYDFLELINIWKIQYLNNELYIDKKLYNFNKHKCFFTSLEFYLNKYIYENVNYCLKENTFIYKFLNHNLKYNYLYKFKPILKNIKIPIYNYESIYDSLEYIFIDEYTNISKYIARHFRKKIKKKNYKFYFSNYLFFNSKAYRSNYRSLLKEGTYKNIDKYLYAYIMWKKFVEGLNDYSKVDSYNFFDRKKRKENMSNSLFYKYINHELKNYIWLLKNNKCYDGFEDIGILFSSLERIIGDILVDYFKCCLDFIKNKKKFEPYEIVDFNCNIDINFKKYFAFYDQNNRVGYIIKN